MVESVYRDGDESLRAAIADLTRQARELGAKVDHEQMRRFDPGRLAKLDAKWRAAESAGAEALLDGERAEALVQACDGLRAIVADLDDAVTNGVSPSLVASGEARERSARVVRNVIICVLVSLALGFSGCVMYTCSNLKYSPGSGYP